MSKQDADFYGISEEERHLFVRYDGAKANLSLVTGKAKWFKRESVQIPNGDWVGVLEPWEPPSAFDGVTADDLRYIQRQVQARVDAGDALGPTAMSKDNWVGELIAQRCSLDPQEDKKRINLIFKEWLKNGAFKIEKLANSDHKIRQSVVVGKWVEQDD